MWKTACASSRKISFGVEGVVRPTMLRHGGDVLARVLAQLLLDRPDKVDEVLDEAKAIAKTGKPVCVNVMLAKSDFREGSISI